MITFIAHYQRYSRLEQLCYEVARPIRDMRRVRKTTDEIVNFNQLRCAINALVIAKLSS